MIPRLYVIQENAGYLLAGRCGPAFAAVMLVAGREVALGVVEDLAALAARRGKTVCVFDLEISPVRPPLAASVA